MITSEVTGLVALGLALSTQYPKLIQDQSQDRQEPLPPDDEIYLKQYHQQHSSQCQTTDEQQGQDSGQSRATDQQQGQDSGQITTQCRDSGQLASERQDSTTPQHDSSQSKIELEDWFIQILSSGQHEQTTNQDQSNQPVVEDHDSDPTTDKMKKCFFFDPYWYIGSQQIKDREAKLHVEYYEMLQFPESPDVQMWSRALMFSRSEALKQGRCQQLLNHDHDWYETIVLISQRGHSQIQIERLPQSLKVHSNYPWHAAQDIHQTISLNIQEGSLNQGLTAPETNQTSQFRRQRTTPSVRTWTTESVPDVCKPRFPGSSWSSPAPVLAY